MRRSTEVMFTKKIAFAGAYGISSQGDDAALIAIVESLRRRINTFDAVVITRHAQENPYALYGLRSVQNIEYDRKTESVGKWFRGFNYGDDRSHLKLLQKEIGSSDLLVLGAGNWLVDFTIDLLRGPIPYLMILTLMAKMTGTPVMWFGMSVGPIRTGYGRNLAKLAADLADAITVRDQKSCVELRRLGYNGSIVQLPDAVLGLNPPPMKVTRAIASWRDAHNSSAPVITISVREMPSDSVLETQQYVERFAAICDELASRYSARLLFIPQCVYQHGNANEDDRYISRLIVDRMKHAGNAIIAGEKLTVEQCLSMYSRADLALCTRLHANVYAAIQGVPPIAISYLPKVSSFMHWLGCDDMVVPMQELSSQIVLDKVGMALAKRNALSESVLARVAVGRAEVERYADIACDLLAMT